MPHSELYNRSRRTKLMLQTASQTFHLSTRGSTATAARCARQIGHARDIRPPATTASPTTTATSATTATTSTTSAAAAAAAHEARAGLIVSVLAVARDGRRAENGQKEDVQRRHNVHRHAEARDEAQRPRAAPRVRQHLAVPHVHHICTRDFAWLRVASRCACFATRCACFVTRRACFATRSAGLLCRRLQS